MANFIIYTTVNNSTLMLHKNTEITWQYNTTTDNEQKFKFLRLILVMIYTR